MKTCNSLYVFSIAEYVHLMHGSMKISREDLGRIRGPMFALFLINGAATVIDPCINTRNMHLFYKYESSSFFCMACVHSDSHVWGNNNKILEDDAS